MSVSLSNIFVNFFVDLYLQNIFLNIMSIKNLKFMEFGGGVVSVLTSLESLKSY